MNGIKWIAIVVLWLAFWNCNAQPPAFKAFENDEWVTARLKSMTLKEKIGQLIMIAVYPEKDEDSARIVSLIKEYKPGGILVMEGSAGTIARRINTLQEISSVPLIAAMDAESGIGFRVSGVVSFPHAQSLGAVRDNDLIYRMGEHTAQAMRALGIHMNFAPVADVNTNPDNPVINGRSFGEDKDNVAEKCLAFATGLQSEKVAAVAKHFPGHGDTQQDSHLTLPVLKHQASRLDSVEMFPFKKLMGKGIAGIMTGHLAVPSMDPSGTPASLSRPVLTTMLREKMKFSGLIISDAMNMRGVTLPRGKAEVQALKAGTDLLEYVEDVPKVVEAVETAVKNKILSLEEIDQKCRRILALKRWTGLNHYQPSGLAGLDSLLNLPSAGLVNRRLVEGSLTVLKNKDLLPLKRLDTLKIATLAIGNNRMEPFQDMISRYTVTDHYFLDKDTSAEAVTSLVEKLKDYNLVIAGIHGLGPNPGNRYRVTEVQSSILPLLMKNTRLVTLFFGNAYALRFFNGIENGDALIVAYEDNQTTQETAAQLVFGAISSSGRLPVTPDPRFPAGSGLALQSINRLKYTLPEEAGISSLKLKHKMDSLSINGLNAGAYPGCQVLVARHGKVIFHSCYGYLSYEKKEPLTWDKLYDFASVTKVSGPLPAIIRLTDEGKLDLDKKMSDYFDRLKNSNKEDILVKDVLTHQSRLPVVIPYWTSKLAKNRELRESVFKDHPLNEDYIRISSRLYMDKKYIDTMYQEIRDVPLLKAKKYTYTCMGFLLWPPIVEKITGQNYESYIKNTFYRPLGAWTLTYNPWKYFPANRMVPTEVDDYFRMEPLQGFVHDEGAAMLGGISGNAGLFGTVNDLAKLWQMYLWKGYYGGERFFSEKTVEKFTSVQFPENDNRRGLGFDKPLLDNKDKTPEEAYPCKSASPVSFGHSGYTGTFVWADPSNGLLFFLFANRVNPTRNNDLLSSMRIRGTMLQVLYDLIEESEKKK